MIQRKLKLCKCGCGKEGYIWARGYLKGHEPNKPPKPIKKVSSKQQERIKENKAYYKVAIAKNIAKNKGKCICEECSSVIVNPKGINVSHVIAGSTNMALYHDQRNNFILCGRCEQIWTAGSRSKMNIYERSEEIKIELTHEYYSSLF